MNLPTAKEVADAEVEGQKAATDGRNFSDHCPYLYSCFSGNGMTTQEFHAFKRPMMDAWFRGWKNQKAAAK